MRLLFLGSGAFGIPSLAAMHDRHEIAAIVTQPDRPAGRKRMLTPTPVAEWAMANAPHVPLERPENINEPGVLGRVRAYEADAWVVIAYGQRLSDELHDDRFAINLHASRLPRWRGAAPIAHAILAGDEITGNSVIDVASRMDAGDVHAMSERPIGRTQTAGELHDALAEDGPDLLLKVLGWRENNSLQPKGQDESRVTLAPKLSKSDGWIRFLDGADACRRRINGLSPWPAVTARIGDETLKLLCAKSSDLPHEEPTWRTGALVEHGDELAIACGTPDEPSVLAPCRVQAPGKRETSWGEYIRGARLSPADRADDLRGADTC